MAEMDSILPVSAGVSPVISIVDDIDAEHEEQGQPGRAVVYKLTIQFPSRGRANVVHCFQRRRRLESISWTVTTHRQLHRES